MGEDKPYTILFAYEIVEESIKFHLQADIILQDNNTYLVNNIRHAGKLNGSIIPPISLIKDGGNWIYADSKKETTLSLAVGHAIDEHGQATGG